jgi:hypothetical protein
LTGSGLSDFVIERSAVRTSVVAVELLLVKTGSTVGLDTATLAVLVIVPVAVPLTIPRTVMRAVAPLFRLRLALKLDPLPELPLPHAPVPTVTEHVQLALVRALGKVSVTVAPVTLLGPTFETSIVYVSVPPRSTGSGLSAFEIERSAFGRAFVGSESLSFAAVGSGVRPEVGMVTLLQRSTPAGLPLATHVPV